MEKEFLEKFNSDQRLVVFLSHRLYTKGNLQQNVSSQNYLAKELTEMGFTVIRPSTLCPWLTFKGKEVNRKAAMNICKSVIRVCHALVFDQNKVSDGVLEEIQYAKEHNIPVFEFHNLRRMIER